MLNLVLTTVLSFQVNLIYVGTPEWTDSHWIQVQATSYSERYDILFYKSDYYTEFRITTMHCYSEYDFAEIAITYNYDHEFLESEITNPHILLLDTVLGKL